MYEKWIKLKITLLSSEKATLETILQTWAPEPEYAKIRLAIVLNQLSILKVELNLIKL
jgi:hypothetical protein